MPSRHFRKLAMCVLFQVSYLINKMIFINE